MSAEISNRYLLLAKNMALKSRSKFRLGAVLIKKNRVISAGFNQMGKTHPIMQKYLGKSEFTLGLHAEVHSTVGVSAEDLHGADIWVCRLHKDGSLALAAPCRVCRKFLVDVGIRKVHFTNSIGNVECLNFQ